jgi:chemotaxis protein histidine kinase CheA
MFLPVWPTPDAKKSRRWEFRDPSTGIRKAAARYAIVGWALFGLSTSLRESNNNIYGLKDAAPYHSLAWPRPLSPRSCQVRLNRTPNGETKMSIFKRETAELEKIDEVEGEIREFVRRDVAGLGRQQRNDGEMVADNISSLLQRVSANSVQEIERLIGELKMLRDQLQHESERVQREIVEYASLSQAATQSTKIITESLNRWRQVPDVR